MPAMRASRAPRDAAAAPTRTTGCVHPQPDAAAASASGAADAAVASGPSTASTVIATIAYTATAIDEREHDRAGDRAARIACTSSPIVAMRAYPAKAKNSRPPDCRMPYTPPSVRLEALHHSGSGPAAAPAATTTASGEQHDDHDHPGQLRRARHAEVVDGDQRGDRDDRDRALPARGAAYAANVSAIAAQLASLPITKHQPAMKPHHGPSSARP